MQVQKYKQTEIGEIPEEWRISPLSEVSYKIMKGIFDMSPTNYVDDGVPFLRISDINNGQVNTVTPKLITEEMNNRFPASELHPGDVVISKVGSVGLAEKVAKIPDSIMKCNISQNLVGVKLNKDKLIAEYLLSLLQLPVYMGKVLMGSNTTTLKSIQLEVLRKLLIPLPPLKEQQKIASILSNVDNLIQKTDQVIEQIQRLKKGLMQRLLTKGIGHTKFKKTELGEIPEEWTLFSIKDITIRHKQGFYTNSSYSKNGIKLVRITDLLNPKLSYDTMPYLDLDKKTINDFKVSKGDFLIARSGAIGRYGIVKDDIPCVFGSYIIRFVFDDKKVENDYMGYLFQSEEITKQLHSIKQGSSNININAENIKAIKVCLPGLREQQKIASILSNIDILIQTLKNKKENEEILKKGLMQQLLTGKIRVKV